MGASFPVLMMQNFAGDGYFGRNGSSQHKINMTTGSQSIKNNSAWNTNVQDCFASASTPGTTDNAGWNIGLVNIANNLIEKVGRMPFSTETDAFAANNISPPRLAHGSCQSLVKGYALGGFNQNDFSTLQSTQSVTFSTAVVAASGALLNNTYNTNGFRSETHGYYAGGAVSSPIATIAKMPFSTEVWANSSASLSSAQNQVAIVEKAASAYMLGGVNGSTFTNVIAKLVKATDTRTNLSATLALVRSGGAAFESDSTGFLFQGQTTGFSLTADSDALQFSTETRFDFSANIANTVSSVMMQTMKSGGY